MILLLSASLAAAQQGEIVGVVFRPDGAPVNDAIVSSGSVSVTTGRDGTFRLALAAGTVDVHVLSPGQPDAVLVAIPVLDGRTTELLVTVAPEGLRSLVEAPTAAAAPSEAVSGPPGVLTGTLTDAESGEPLAGVRLFVRGLSAQATTDEEGNFTLTLPSGSWDVSAVRAGYGTEGASVEVVADETRELTLGLTKSGLVLDDLTVKAPKITGGAASLLDERQASSSVSDVLGAEQMSRAGDPDAASALRRVTGLTVIGGKYVYVRGLGDRYSATLLDGSSLPSPEPEKRVVPLDLFPSALLDSVVVQKTFSPDRPAEFGGGVVEVRTRSIPKDPLLTIALSGTYSAQATGVTTPFGETGPTDWLGLGRDHRALPVEVAVASASSPIKAGGIFSTDGYSADELERFGELIPNRWGLDPRTLPPDLGVTVTGGGSLDFGKTNVGALAGFVFSNGWDVDDGFQKLYSSGVGGELQLKRNTDFVETQNRVRLGAAVAVGVSRGENTLRSTTLLMRNSTGTALTFFADDPTGSNDTRNGRVDWIEQQLLYEQLATHLDLAGVEVDVRYAWALATGDQPDRRDWTYIAAEGGDVLSQRGSWSEILYTTLDDRSDDLVVDVKVPVLEGEIQTGAKVLIRDRVSTTRRFGYNFQGSESIDLFAPIDEVIVPENIGAEGPDDPGYLELEENTQNSDDYQASQDLYAGYLMGNAPWTRRIATLLGARVEASTQEVSTFEQFDTNQVPVAAELATTDLLPAATATIGIGPKKEPDRMQVRLGYGRTLSRPEFRELSEVAFYDYRSGRLLYGNPDLKRATIENVDARWEFYPADGETVSAGVFFKQFYDPIESVVAVSAVSGSVGTFANASSATNLGTEVDLRKRMVSELWLTANASLISSRVELSEEAQGNSTSSKRPLQGQSPWVANVQVSWEDPERRTNLALLYNAFGPRIVGVGTAGIPDTYELPVHRVDLVASQGFGSHWVVRARGANLLDWPIRERVGDVISSEMLDGWSAGLAVTWAP